MELARLLSVSAARRIQPGGDNPATRPIVVAIPPIIDRSIFTGKVCCLLHAAVAVEDAFIEDDSGTGVEEAMGTLACGGAASSLRFCAAPFRGVGEALAGGLDALLDLERDCTEVVWMGGGLTLGGEDDSDGWVKRFSVQDSMEGGLRVALFFFFAIFESSFPFFHGWVGMASPRLAMGSGSSSSEGGFVLFISCCSAASVYFASS